MNEANQTDPNESVNESEDEQSNLEPSLDELSQIRTEVNSDRQQVQQMFNNLSQKYGEIQPQLEEVVEAYQDDDLDLSDEKKNFLESTLMQVEQMNQLADFLNQ